MTPILTVKDLSKIYRMDGVEVAAVKNISFIIKKGEMASIMGPSGSGKSTLMHLIGLLDKPTSGQILLDGEDVSSLSENKLAQIRNRKIGFIFQSFNLLSRTSAFDNVQLPLIYSGVSAKQRKEKALEALVEVGLENRINHLPSQLSGGQQQRVAIARALVNNPDFILADEPTGNLDSKSGEEIMKILTSLNSHGHTIIVVTHDITVAKRTKKIIKIKDGQLVGDQN